MFYILFITITITGFYFLFTNRQRLALFIFATAIIGCGDNLMSARLLVCIMLALAGIFLTKEKLSFANAVIILYLLYLCWLIVGIILSPTRVYGFRVFLKYLYPFLMLLFAYKVIQIDTGKQFYLKSLKVILSVGLFGVLWQLVLIRIPVVNRFLYSVLYWGPAIIDFYPIPLTIALLLFSYTKKPRYVLYAILLVLPSVSMSIRTGLLAITITVVVFAVVRHKLKSVPYILITGALLISAVLYIPAIRDKMFHKQMSAEEIMARRGELTVNDINSSGRFALWEWSLAHFYQGKEWTGSGLGRLQHAFYTGNHPFDGLRVVHNDYIQILCDSGLTGLLLYLLILLSLIVHSIKVYFTSDKAVVKIAGLVAGVGMAGMLSTLYTDNVVNYSLMTLSFPFALYGMMLGLKQSCHD